ncbi:THAP domain-containing protein 5-like isoform X1 [Thunnus albacares]|uniref:THAP domain-containing protein 5-like isoform X1 n=1 Tax=Thunnus albacares TaxID=8236 RepID=UPI001CF6352B|nr:THAP domain-containing protein 5-like isoform X1 [Thunnus albacares]
MSCSAFGCTKRPCKESNLQFFRFPLSDHARLKRWIINVRRKNWTPSSSSRLCCNHFEEDQFFIDKKGKRRLKDTAVPTIFNFPPYLLKKKETTKATRIKSVSMTMKVSDCSVSTTVPSCSAPGFIAHYDWREPITSLCSVFDNEADTEMDNRDSVGDLSAEYNIITVKEEPDDEISICPENTVMVKTDADEVVSGDRTEHTTSQDSQTITHDHSYLCTKPPQPSVCTDHSYIGSESPRTLKRKVHAVQEQLVAARKKLKLKCQQTRRLKSRLLTLKDLIKVLRKKLEQKNYQQI